MADTYRCTLCGAGPFTQNDAKAHASRSHADAKARSGAKKAGAQKKGEDTVYYWYAVSFSATKR